jgi:hypothetical protein
MTGSIELHSVWRCDSIVLQSGVVQGEPSAALGKMAELVFVVDVAVFAIVVAGVVSPLGGGVKRTDSLFSSDIVHAYVKENETFSALT